MRRYVVFSMTDLEQECGVRDAELHAGADTDRAFTKRVVARSIINGHDIHPWLQTYLAVAGYSAKSLTEDDLDQLYAPQRKFPPDAASPSERDEATSPLT